MKSLITISIPVLNEEENIDRLIKELDALAQAESKYDFEFLFTDNASKDATIEKLKLAALNDHRIKYIRFSRNFGFQKSILTNFLEAKGAAAIQIDADLQDPPSMISEFLRHWEKGYKVVYGIRRKRRESRTMNSVRRFYYRLVSYLSDTDVPNDVGDFRLIDRVIIEHLREVREQTPYLRGLIAGFGYAQVGLPYDRQHRQAGLSKFNLLKLVELGIDGITAQSTRPLRLITLFGFVMSTFTVILSAYYFFNYVFLGTPQNGSGFTTIVLLLLFLIGLISVSVGLLGEYVGRIFNNTRGLPLTIVAEYSDKRLVKEKPIQD